MALSLANIIEQVGKDKGIGKEVLIDALESAMLKAAEKRFGATKDIEAHYAEDRGEIELFVFKTVVEEVEDPDLEMTLEEARELDPEAVIGDSIGVKLNASEFGRIDAQTAKQIIIQKVREAERELVYNEYSSKKGEIITGIVQRFEKGDMIVDLGRTEALLPRKEQVRREGYRQGERIRGLVIDVRKEAKGPQVIISRTHPDFLKKLFELEVPEVYEGIVEIKACSREPGDRAKIAVASNNPDVDPVGACVGIRGSRVQAVVQELKGEKIDIVHWSDEPAVFAKNILSPAQITKVIVDEEEKALEVIVPEDQLSLAIGKRGQNVRLAAKLTGWKIDIRTEEEARAGEALTPEEALRLEVEAHMAQSMAAEAASAEAASAEAGTVEAAPPEAGAAAGGAEESPETAAGAQSGAAAAAEGAEEAGDGAEGAQNQAPSRPDELAALGIGDEAAAALREAGFTTVESLAGAEIDVLGEIEGLDAEALDRIRAAIEEYRGRA